MRRIFAIVAIAWLMIPAPAFGQETITVLWDANPEADIAGYTLYSGTAPGQYTSSQWLGNVTQRTMTLPPGTFYFAIRARNIYGLESALSSEVSTTIAQAPPPIPNWQAMWQNTVNGALATWSMADSVMVSGASLGLGRIDPAWVLKASADFDGDLQKDLLFQHPQGNIAVWRMSGNAFLESRVIGSVSDANWQIVGAGDFTADGHTDILFRHERTGTLSVWVMNRMAFSRGAAVSPGRVEDLNWKVAGIGDFNGDSRPDILWQHVGNGTITSWLMNGTTMQAAGPFSVQGTDNPQWKLRGAEDVNDDGSLDLLWQLEGSNHLAVWYMSGRTLLNARLLTPAQVSEGWSWRGAR